MAIHSRIVLLKLCCGLSFIIMFSKSVSSFIVRSSRVLHSSFAARKQFLSVAAPLSSSSSPLLPRQQPPATAFYHTTSLSAMGLGEEMMKEYSSPLVGTDIPLAMQALAEADCVCFDVDSTVINEEGIVSFVSSRKLIQKPLKSLI